MDFMLSRRAFIASTLLGATGLSIGGCAGMPTPPSDIALTRLIDVHAHIFNGADLPVRGFALSVLQLDRPIAALVAGFARSAFPARREIANLRAGLAMPDAADLQTVQADHEALLAAYFQSVASEPAEQTALSAGQRQATDDEAALRLEGLRRVRALYEPATVRRQARSVLALADAATAGGLAQTILRSEQPPASGTDRLAARTEDPCESGELSVANLSAIFRWMAWLTHPRAFLLDTLHSVFGAGAIPQFLTPSLVDYGFWVRDFGTTSFAEQIELNALLSRRANALGYAMHGFVSFDPWRHAWLKANGQPGGALAWARHAIGELASDGSLRRAGSGFMGVKLYPPMGFRPIANAELPDTAFPSDLRNLARDSRLSPGALLDRAMAELFDWCVAQDVPIMAHCAPSNAPRLAGTGDAPGARAADPAFWRRVLVRWPSLRLNLAHAGGLTTQACADSTGSAGWLDTVFDLLADPAYPHVHADTGDLTELFATGRAEAGDAIIARLRGALARHPAAAERLLYGSDWVMQARLMGHEAYLSAMQRRLVPGLADLAGADFADRFFWRNAQAWLGLQRGSAILRRLEAFYGSWGGLPPLDRRVLDDFTV